MRSLTPRQFNAEINDAMQEIGVTKEKLVSLHYDAQTDGQIDVFYDALFELYVLLREKGFNDYDLTS